MVVLRNFEVTDIDQIEAIERRVFPEGPYDRGLLVHIFTAGQSLNEIALVNGNIVGYIVAIVLDDGIADIENIAVDQGYGRMGIGSTLMNAIEKKLQMLGITRVVLEVRDMNTEAITFYQKHGYRTVDFLKNYYVERYRGSRSAYRMAKVLRAPGPA